LVFLVFALGTDAEELQSMAQDMVAAPIIVRTPQKVKWWGENIVHSAALHATQMIVPLDISVKAGLATTEIEPLNDSRSGQQVQIPIDGAQANFGQPAADNLVQGRCGRVRGELLEFLQEHQPLSSIALLLVGVHGAPYY
jgi:hypothetical protein